MINILGVDPNSKFIAYALMDQDRFILEKGTIPVEQLTQGLNALHEKYTINYLAIEDFVYYRGSIINQYSIATVKIIGRLMQWAESQAIVHMEFPRPEINRCLSGSPRTPEGAMQDVLKWQLSLDKVIRPEHINAAACVALHGYNVIKSTKVI